MMVAAAGVEFTSHMTSTIREQEVDKLLSRKTKKASQPQKSARRGCESFDLQILSLQQVHNNIQRTCSAWRGHQFARSNFNCESRKIPLPCTAVDSAFLKAPVAHEVKSAQSLRLSLCTAATGDVAILTYLLGAKCSKNR